MIFSVPSNYSVISEQNDSTSFFAITPRNLATRPSASGVPTVSSLRTSQNVLAANLSSSTTVLSADNRRSPTTKSSESVAPQNSKGKKKFNFEVPVHGNSGFKMFH